MEITLTPTQQAFISHFGEMGSRWGINRTVGQIYALLYISEAPLCAEDIADTLHISRSNVSMGLKELDSWRLTRIRHFAGDRKDYFTVPEDIWEIVRTLAEQRMQREIEPTLTMLRHTLMETPATQQDSYTHHKMQEMYQLINMLTGWYQEMQKMETEKLLKLLKLGTKVYQLYEMKDKLSLVKGGRKQSKKHPEDSTWNG